MPDLLRASDLIYGRLLTVEEPHMVARYNKALSAFGLSPTKLESFQIDRTGFSPEVADELGDPHYLDPNQVNRRFIILTPAQADLPVVHTAFSNTSQLMHEFFTRNARAIDALTIKDVLYGEIEEQVSKVDDIEDLLSISQVEFRVLSAEDVVGKAAELGKLADRLRQEPDAWRDDALLNRMVELAQVTGDIRQNTLVPDQVIFRHNAFWTSHFGGLYVFVDADVTTVICDPAAPGFRRSRPWQVSYLSITDAEKVYRFLEQTGRIDLPRASWLEASGYLDHRADMAVETLFFGATPDAGYGGADSVWRQTWLHRNADRVDRDGIYPFLQAAKREAIQTGRLDIGEIAPARRFQVIRAKPDHPDAWLVNSLISEFVPADFVSRYVFNKPAFYADYEAYAEPFRAHVVERLKTTYLKDKAGFRLRLYGLRDCGFMLDPIINFFVLVFQWIGRAIGWVIGILLWPFLWAGRWYLQKGWILKAVLGTILAGIAALYVYFIWNTQVWTDFNPDYASAYSVAAAGETAQPAGQTVVPETGDAAPAPSQPATTGEGAARTCLRSEIVTATADLTDFNVNRNAWISSMILYKLGFFGLRWDYTPFFDNKAAFQRGINQALRRTSTELVEVLGRVRSTSSIDNDLQSARGNLQFDEEAWYLGFTAPWLRTPTPTYYRTAITNLRAFNDRLEKCEGVFDARSDNLLRFLDRISNDLGSTAAILRERSENYNGGWFDTRADDRFWFAYGQLYGYNGILHAAHSDFRDVIAQRGLTQLWSRLEDQLNKAMQVRPIIISNGAEAGILMPSHLATMSAYVLQVGAIVEEIRSVLDR